MGFPIPELVIEVTLRSGLADIKENLDDRINDIFSELLLSSLQSRYGQKELDKIKEVLGEREISIYQAPNFGTNEELSFSIGFLDGPEKEHILGGGFSGHEEVSKTATVIVSSVILKGSPAYDSASGILSVDDSVNLTNVYPNHVFVDAADSEFSILGVDNTTGNKQLVLDSGLTIDESGAGLVKSSIDFTQYARESVIREVSVMITAQAKDPLLAAYLHAVLKHILYSDNKSLIEKNFSNIKINDKSFIQQTEFGGDLVYQKAVILSGQVEESWRAEENPTIERADIDVFVEQDEADNEDIDREEQGVRIVE